MHVHGVDRQVVAPRDRQRLGELLGEDPELRRPIGARVRGLLVTEVAGTRAWVDPQADRASRVAATDALDLGEQIDVQVHRMGEHHVQIAVGQVRARVADLVGAPAVLERVQHLTG